MKKFFAVVVFGAVCAVLGYGYANGNIHADTNAVSVHTNNMNGVAHR